jgi:hypothetical protein
MYNQRFCKEKAEKEPSDKTVSFLIVFEDESEDFFKELLDTYENLYNNKYKIEFIIVSTDDHNEYLTNLVNDYDMYIKLIIINNLDITVTQKEIVLYNVGLENTLNTDVIIIQDASVIYNKDIIENIIQNMNYDMCFCYNFLFAMTNYTRNEVGFFNDQMKYGIGFYKEEYLHRISRVATIETIEESYIESTHPKKVIGDIKTLKRNNHNIYMNTKRII